MRLHLKLAAAGLATAAVATVATVATALATGSCPPGQKGVIVEHGGTTTSVCTDADKTVRRIIQESVADPGPLPPLPTMWVAR